MKFLVQVGFVLFVANFLLSHQNLLGRNHPNDSRTEVSEVEDDPTFVLDENRYDEETNEYFKEIALHEEFSNEETKEPSRWTKDMNIYVSGLRMDYMMEELNQIVKELNDLIEPINIRIVSEKSKSNFVVFLGSMEGFMKQFPDVDEERLLDNWGYFSVQTNRGKMYVDLFRTEDMDAQKHLLREELTQSLGLFNDSWKYPESIFYQGWTTTTEFTDMDRKLIDLLYN